MLGVSATSFYYDIISVISLLPIYLHLSTPLQYLVAARPRETLQNTLLLIYCSSRPFITKLR